ncbi:tetranectin-like [Anopheles marshallii]|uniref:tetranectin-like n=1 Tax=Anopheles marshallii TaxID=1521116 RepID=UPI00237B4EA5|nr:tetranectin-like [Anopheles marshallii]
MKACLIALVIVGLVAVGLPTTQALRYTAYTNIGNFYEAYHTCILKGGYLVAIETPTQNALVVAAIKKSGGTGTFWTSGTDFGMEGAWMWVSRNRGLGAFQGYNNFQPTRPLYDTAAKEDCLSISTTGVWKDVDCGSKLPYVCEFTY